MDTEPKGGALHRMTSVYNAFSKALVPTLENSHWSSSRIINSDDACVGATKVWGLLHPSEVSSERFAEGAYVRPCSNTLAQCNEYIKTMEMENTRIKAVMAITKAAQAVGQLESARLTKKISDAKGWIKQARG
jgi:hypothetical protein